MLQYFEEMDELQLKVLRCLEIGLNLSKGTITEKCNEKHENLRLLRYPEEACESDKKAMKRLGVHTDYGSITLLVQGPQGGLQSQSRGGEWHEVPYVKGGIAVQVAMMLERWTNSVLHAAPHTVVSKPVLGADGKSFVIPQRESIAFFCTPNKEAYIEPLPSTITAENPKKYEGFVSLDFLLDRLNATL